MNVEQQYTQEQCFLAWVPAPFNVNVVQAERFQMIRYVQDGGRERCAKVGASFLHLFELCGFPFHTFISHYDNARTQRFTPLWFSSL